MTSEAFEENDKQFQECYKKVKGLIDSGKLPKGYDAEELALFCHLYNNGFLPSSLISNPEIYLKNLYFLMESDAPVELVKKFSIWNAEIQTALKKIENDGTIIKALREYDLINP